MRAATTRATPRDARLTSPNPAGGRMVSSQATHRIRPGRAAAVALWLAGWGLLVATTCGTPDSNIRYAYDENGRLVAVNDPTQSGSNTGIYNYDAAGNVTSIVRQPGSTLSI